MIISAKQKQIGVIVGGTTEAQFVSSLNLFDAARAFNSFLSPWRKELISGGMASCLPTKPGCDMVVEFFDPND